MNEIYHFTKYSTLLKILETDSIKFGNIVNTNAPKEYLEPDISYGYLSAQNRKYGSFDEEKKIVSNELKNYKIACFCRDGKNGGFMKPRMWAEYGQHHEGCCLIFDKKALLNEVNKRYPRETYSRNIS